MNAAGNKYRVVSVIEILNVTFPTSSNIVWRGRGELKRLVQSVTDKESTKEIWAVIGGDFHG